jgi:hypothetical protein
MVGGDYRWRFEHSAGIADCKQGRQLFVSEYFGFGDHRSNMTHLRNCSVVNFAQINKNRNYKHHGVLPLERKGLRMIIFMEKIEPRPPVPLTDEERLQLRLEAVESDDLWVKNFIDRLAGVVQDTKH